MISPLVRELALYAIVTVCDGSGIAPEPASSSLNDRPFSLFSHWTLESRAFGSSSGRYMPTAARLMACPVWVASRELARKAAEWTESSIIICGLAAALWVGTEPSGGE